MTNQTTETIKNFYRAARTSMDEGNYDEALMLVGIARAYPRLHQPPESEVVGLLTKQNVFELHQYVARVRSAYLAEWAEEDRCHDPK